jgi:RNAse (barnase) inhibitor barstar
MAMNREYIYLPKAPYLYVLEASVSEATNFAWSLAQHNLLRVVVRFLRGKKMTKLIHLYDEFAAALQFPYYFGENWNAFYECITDLEWLAGDVYILVITDSMMLLSEEDEEQLDALTNIFQEAGNEWNRPINTPEAWSRPAVAFHVIFQCDESDKQAMVSRLKSVNTTFEEIRLQST